MMAETEIDGDQGLRSSFTTYMAEGEQLCQKGEYKKAVESFGNALILQPSEKHCLVARSKCFLKLGDPESALRDAEASLQEESEFFRGLYQKAEALYAMGDFEFALVYYHRGFKLRPELQEFRLGIQKAQEAIENSVGTPSSVKLENKSDICFLSKQEESKRAKQKVTIKAPKKDTKQQKKVDPLRSQKTARHLLGELYSDKEYLESLLKDEDLVKENTRSGIKLQDLIMHGITYLDTRTEFWRQQKPIYARERDRKIMQQKWNRDKKPTDPSRYILKSLEEIDQLSLKGNAEESCKKAQRVLKTLQSWPGEDIPNRQELIGNLYSCIGNAQMDAGRMETALQSHQKDLEIAKECDLPEAKSRALDNIGRVYARIGKFNDAIKVWEEKIPLAKSSLEKTWLFHEIGRCYLELEVAAEAKEYGEKSLLAAEEAEDVEWQLNASVLVAQAQVKLKDYQSSVSSFEKALERAKRLHNEDAEVAILNALEDANRKLLEQLKIDHDDNEKEDRTPEDNPGGGEETNEESSSRGAA
ncbi:outer dynein arm-docking complex subunit 4 [Spea bombifrons]|uniref:outer dynein arm-docking complex subunit 4 n=1 Tax=Spea bombifrons TaxID=233779 RepID=UPI00234961BC|nr:outer dynein arm-docking complex subunit 4 [Spea bombifrons]